MFIWSLVHGGGKHLEANLGRALERNQVVAAACAGTAALHNGRVDCCRLRVDKLVRCRRSLYDPPGDPGYSRPANGGVKSQDVV